MVSSRSARVGAWAAAAMAAAYVVVIRVASGSTEHLVDQIRADWWLLTPIVLGFGVQVGLIAELRRVHRVHAAELAAGSAGAGASAAGMAACCAHHIAELRPFLGLTGAAAFLTDWRGAFLGVGIAVNAVAIALAVRRLRSFRSMHERPREEDHQCALV